jgi:hypothetical protein
VVLAAGVTELECGDGDGRVVFPVGVIEYGSFGCTVIFIGAGALFIDSPGCRE